MNQKTRKALLHGIGYLLLVIGLLIPISNIQYPISHFTLSLASAATDYSLNQYDPLGPVKNPSVAGNPIKLAISVLTYALGLFGAVVFGIFIYAGVTILFSRGNPKQVEKGKKTLLYATLGLVCIFFSYAALNLIFNLLEEIKK